MTVSSEQSAVSSKHKRTDHVSRILVLLCLLPAFFLPAGSVAQQPKKLPRIGYLSTVDAARDSSRADTIRLALRDLGYIEGHNITIEYRYAEGRVDRFSELATELVRLKVDMILLAGGFRVVRAAKNATKTIPIVMMGGGLDPVEAGLVEGLARPGGNVTGIASLSDELGGKRLELLKEAVPKLIYVAVLHDPATGPAREVKEILPAAARVLGVTVRPWEVRRADEFEKVFAALSKEHPDGLYVITAGPLIRNNVNRTVGFTLKSRLPSIYNNKEGVDAGGLMSYGADLSNSYRRVAYYVDKILKGVKPADLPVEQPTKF